MTNHFPPMNLQDTARIALLDLQIMREREPDLTADERMERLMRDYFGRFPSEREYLETLDQVSREMGDV